MSDTPSPTPDAEPPPRAFRFKTPTFPVANPPSSTPSTNEPTDVREHFRIAEQARIAAMQNRTAPAENEVHDILRDNLARANAAGLNDVKPVAKRPSRRLRDFVIVLALFNGPVVGLGIAFRRDPIVLLCLFAAFVLFNIRVVWTMWIVSDNY